MYEYAYDIVLRTPLGAKNGTMELQLSNDKIYGFMNVLGRTEPCHGKISEKGVCKLSGRIVTLMREFDYTATGYLGSDGLNLILHGGNDVFEITGIACPQEANK